MNYGSPNSQLDILWQAMKGSLLFTTLELIILKASKEYFDFTPKYSRWILFKKSNKKGKKYYLMIPTNHGHMLV